jgi:hypothetical protein
LLQFTSRLHDIKAVGKQEDCESFFHELAKRVKVENKGPIKSFLQINVIRDWDQHLIAINHFAVYTRPDIAFAVSKPAQFNANPTATHLKAAIHVLRYLQGTSNLCIVYKRQPGRVNILGYSDSDWSSDGNDRISHTGYAFIVHGSPASRTARKQQILRCNHEYMALSDASREADAHGQFFQELNIPSLCPLRQKMGSCRRHDYKLPKIQTHRHPIPPSTSLHSRGK